MNRVCLKIYNMNFIVRTSKGHCFSSEILLGVSANPLSQYIYGEISALTVGKIFRMLGSKIQLPPPIDKTGFPEGLVVSKRDSILDTVVRGHAVIFELLFSSTFLKLIVQYC